jgi:hypothetical protein
MDMGTILSPVRLPFRRTGKRMDRLADFFVGSAGCAGDCRNLATLTRLLSQIWWGGASRRFGQDG